MWPEEAAVKDQEGGVEVFRALYCAGSLPAPPPHTHEQWVFLPAQTWAVLVNEANLTKTPLSPVDSAPKETRLAARVLEPLHTQARGQKVASSSSTTTRLPLVISGERHHSVPQEQWRALGDCCPFLSHLMACPRCIQDRSNNLPKVHRVM